MSEIAIPEDIMRTAADTLDNALCHDPEAYGGSYEDSRNAAITDIARAILAERTRCNEILRAAFGKNVTVETLQALATADAIVASHSKEEAPQ